MKSRITLVSCVKTKQKFATSAENMYTSPLFKSMRWYAQKNSDAWFVLSAEYGLLRPDETIKPYEKTLNTMSKAERLTWAARVQSQLLAVLAPGAAVTMLAGERYRENLIPFLESRGFTVTVPMYGLSFGRQLSWLNEQRCNEQYSS